MKTNNKPICVKEIIIYFLKNIQMKFNYKKYLIKESDITGSIKGFPIEIVQKMLENQVNQGNKLDIKPFQIRASIDANNDGFDWIKTIEGFRFWNNIINEGNFKLFFKKYPK